MPNKVKVFKDSASEWRWHERAENGRIVSESGEGYSRKDDAKEAAERENPGLEVEVEDVAES